MAMQATNSGDLAKIRPLCKHRTLLFAGVSNAALHTVAGPFQTLLEPYLHKGIRPDTHTRGPAGHSSQSGLSKTLQSALLTPSAPS